MTTSSGFIAWDGTSGPRVGGVAIFAVGIIGVLFFGPIIGYVSSELLRIRASVANPR